MLVGRVLPVGWERCLFGDAVDYGNTKKTEPADIPDDAWVLELEDIEKNSSKLLARSTFAERKSKSTKNAFEKGAVLYGKLRPYLNKVLLADQPGFCSTEIIPLLAGEGVEAGYLFHWLKSPEFLSYTEEVSHGINMPRLGTEAGRKAPLVLAPLNEQRRIAAKLDTTLAAVEACRKRLDGVAVILKRFRQAVLAAATSGELTREWREENADANQWGSTTFGAECHYITVGFVGKMADQYVAHGVPFLRSLNVRPFRFDRENLAFISPAFHQSIIKSSLLPGDLAVVRTGAPGQCCVIPDELPEANCSDLVIARPGPRLIADFGAIVINSSLGQGFVKSEQVGVAQAHFNVGSMKRAPLYLPSIAEQKEIVRRAQGLFTLADQLEARLTAARKLVDRLTPALLAKAFRGELLPQDPSEEPASALLERIRAARQAEAGAGKPSRRGRRKAATNPDQIAMEAAPVSADFLAGLLRECGALSERALLAVSELEPQRFQQQLYRELESGTAREVKNNGQVLLEAVG